MKGTLIAGALVVVAFVGYVLLVITSTGEPTTPAGSPKPWVTTTTVTPTTSTSPGPPATAYDEAATRGGDGAPHQAENRGNMQPDRLTDEARQRLDAEGATLLPTLEQVRAAGVLTPDAVVAALVAAGYETDKTSAMFRTLPVDGTTQYVVFGIRADGGCVTGMVTPTEVDAQAMGPYPEWGCLPPDTH